MLDSSDAVPKVLIFQSGVSFLEFKRCCGEKLGLPCTRVFLVKGGEIESVSQMQNDDIIVCTPGNIFQPPSLRTLFAESETLHKSLSTKYQAHSHSSYATEPLSLLSISAGPSEKKMHSNDLQSKSLSAFSSDKGERKKLGGGLSRFRNAVQMVQQRNNIAKVKALGKDKSSASLIRNSSQKLRMAEAVLAVTAALKRNSVKESENENKNNTEKENEKKEKDALLIRAPKCL